LDIAENWNERALCIAKPLPFDLELNPNGNPALATGCRPQCLETLAQTHGATRGAVLPAKRMRFDPRLDLVAAFVIRFNLEPLPATTAPVMPNAVGERTPERRSRAGYPKRSFGRSARPKCWTSPKTETNARCA
jgi:hypothetical protein